MSRPYVPADLRRRVAEQARHRCGFCLSQRIVTGTAMEVEHIVPAAHGGPTAEDNLWLACTDCNKFKGSRLVVPDDATGQLVRLFDPRHQVWSDHFMWAEGGAVVVGLTPTGRATVVSVRLNRTDLVDSRRLWASAGWHPPVD